MYFQDSMCTGNILSRLYMRLINLLRDGIARFVTDMYFRCLHSASSVEQLLVGIEHVVLLPTLCVGFVFMPRVFVFKSHKCLEREI